MSLLAKLKTSNFFELVNPYSFYHLCLQLANFLASFICLSFILPEQAGLWQTLTLFESYMLIARFGVLNAFNREFPFYLGKGEKDKAQEFLYTAEFFSLGVSVLLFLAAILSLLFYVPQDTEGWKMSVLAISLVAPFNMYRNFLDLTYRTSKDFKLLSKVQLRLIVVVLATIPIVKYFGYNGYLARFVIIGFCSVVFYTFFRAQPFAPKWNTPNFKFLFKEGLPLFYSNYIMTFIGGFPRLLLLYFASFQVLGLFAPVQAVIGLGVMIPSSISLYLLPYLNFDFGKNNSKEAVINNGLKAAGFSMLVMLPISLVLWFLIPPAVNYFLPKYESATLAMQLGLVLSVFASFKISFNVFSVLKAWNHMYGFLAISLIIRLVIPFIAIKIYPNHNILLVLIVALILTEIIMILASIFIIKKIT